MIAVRFPCTSACGASGQATVETVALLPVLAAVALAVLTALAAGAADEAASHGAHAAAVAVLQDRDPESAARTALPGWSRSAVRFSRTGAHVHVTVRPKVPLRFLARHFTAEASAFAPRTAPAVAAPADRGGDGASSRPRGRR